MKATKIARSTISREKFTLFVSGLLDRYPNPEGDPQPPGPWDPLIRQTLEKVFGPHPEPWRIRFESANERLRELARVKPEIWDVIGGRFDAVALNPQPLPPRWAVAIEFLRLAAERLLMIQEGADAINKGTDRSIIVVGDRISELVDFVCGNNFPRKILPRPGPESDPRLRGQDLVLMGAELLRYSKTIANETLTREFAAAGDKLIDTGLERL
ncbi:MAG TPA: hypothetical protein VFA65_02980 [Bryobacteraceae bacterium]|nr:hypothetical protein [Bryobacteraceae bacterium]